MSQGYREFKNAEATIAFIRRINNLFDIMNTKTVKNASKNIYKDPLTSKHIDHVLSYFEECTKYIKLLQVVNNSSKRVCITKSIWKCGFKGFIIDMQNIRDMYNEYVNINRFMNTFPTLTLFFGKIRSLNGQNDNPTVQQFAAAYRKLLANNDILASAHGNCTDVSYAKINRFSNILQVPLTRKSQIPPHDDEQEQEEFNREYEFVVEKMKRLEFKPHGGSNIDDLQQSSIAHVANLIENIIRSSKDIYCSHCAKIFDENEKIESCYVTSSNSQK